MEARLCGGRSRTCLTRVGDLGPHLWWCELRQIFPEKFPPIQHLPAPHVEQIHGQHAIFVVISEDIGIIALDRSDALLFLQLFDSRNQVAIFRCPLVLLVLGSLRHAFMQRARERSEEHTSELQSPDHLVCRLLLEKKKKLYSLYDVYIVTSLCIM